MNVGDRVRVERDETRYPSKGTWPRLRGKTGTIVEFNLGEIGVCFGNVTRRKDRVRKDGSPIFNIAGDDPVTWFQPHEVRTLGVGSQSRIDRPNTQPSIDRTRELVNV